MVDSLLQIGSIGILCSNVLNNFMFMSKKINLEDVMSGVEEVVVDLLERLSDDGKLSIIDIVQIFLHGVRVVIKLSRNA